MPLMSTPVNPHTGPTAVSTASYYGVPTAEDRVPFTAGSSGTPAGSWAKVKPAHKPQPKRSAKKCRANDDTCNGWRVTGEEFCQGHLRSMSEREA